MKVKGQKYSFEELIAKDNKIRVEVSINSFPGVTKKSIITKALFQANAIIPREFGKNSALLFTRTLKIGF